MCFGGDIWARQLERSIGGLQGQGYCVERLSLLNVEAVEIFFMLIAQFYYGYLVIAHLVADVGHSTVLVVIAHLVADVGHSTVLL